MNKYILLVFFGIISSGTALAQTPFERLGQKAMMEGEFKTAASYFEKAYSTDNSNMNALWLMGYSNYHAAEYKKSVDTFNKLIIMKPTETVAYYYRGKAKVLLSNSIKDYRSIEKEKLLLSAIKDFSTSIDLSPNDMKLYQNRGLAYQEYGIFKSQKINDTFNKSAVINSINASIIDLQKVLDENTTRRDILSQIEKSKQILAELR
jgi:tetratricopeptide (TPR) repeat protein